MRTEKLVYTISFAILIFAGDVAKALTNTIPPARAPGSIAFNALNAIHSMDSSNRIYSSIQITNGKISALSNTPLDGATSLPNGAAIYPGFIDSHSHAISLKIAQSVDATGKPYWISLASVNVMLLPNCATPMPGSTTCFSPVTTQDLVNSLIKNAKPNAANWILGWNYDPSRLACTLNGTASYGFNCPNFENQNTASARQQLDLLQPTTPTFVTSESGHIFYVNSAALNLLNICNVSSPTTDSCYTPIYNIPQETALAKNGQLDEDLAIYALSVVDGLLAANYSGGNKEKELEFNSAQIENSLNLYSQLGYTTVQEGAASDGLIKVYMATAAAMAQASKYLPATVAFLEYPGTTANDFPPTVGNVQKIQNELTKGNFDMFVAGIKAYADGSNPGYTGDMASPVSYMNLFSPFANPEIFPQQPYDGLPDYNQQDLSTVVQAAHKGGFPLWVHTNGNQAQTNVLNALEGNTSPTLRDVVVHFTMPTQSQVQSVPSNQIGVTFLMNDFYYYYQPLCEQLVGADATQNLYPAAWAQQNNLRYGLHSDASVTPPSPLFSMWVASTRNYQQADWLPPLSSPCAPVNTSQKISLLQAMQAYTSNAAWLYNRESTIGSLQNGFVGDLVVLSADPLAPGAELSTIYVLYTIHNGNIVYPASGQGPATTPPVWPE